MNFNTIARSIRAGSEILETYKSWNWSSGKPTEQGLALLKYALRITAVADLIFLTLHMTGRSVSPYVEWATLVPRLVIFFAGEELREKTVFDQNLKDLSTEQMVVIIGKIITSTVSILFPTGGKYCNYSITGVEMGLRVILPLTRK